VSPLASESECNSIACTICKVYAHSISAHIVQFVICINLVMLVVGSIRALTLCTMPPPATTSMGAVTVPVMDSFFVTGSTAADDTDRAPLSALQRQGSRSSVSIGIQHLQQHG
jgi:hypothetical protein